ncbi:MAG: NAD(P)/FAD-dependent oxidoreductase [Deltaproteobacteria bacterium]
MPETSFLRFDVIILGVGPAGLQAAIHAARKKARVLLLGRATASNLYRAHIENYAFVQGVKTGEELLATGRAQALGFGAEILEEDVIKTEQTPEGDFLVTTESGRVFNGITLLFATGVKRQGLGLAREKELVGRGVSYCVDCDANFYREATVVVTGDGSAAAHGALTLSKIASSVSLVSKDMDVSPALRKELAASKVALYQGRNIARILGAERVEGVMLDDGTELPADGLFIERGAKGAMELASFLGVALDPEKFTHILTDRSGATNIPGIYAAGDICGPPYQMAKAVGEGCVAGLAASTYALRRKKEGAAAP